MATKPKSGLGGTLGVLMAVVVVGGVAASPLYLGFLRSDERALDAAVADKIESIRRDVLSLDPHLAVIKDAYDSGLPEAKPTAKQIERAASRPRLYTQEMLTGLEQTARVLREAYSRTKDHGTPPSIGSKIASGAPSPQASLGDLEKKYFDAQGRALRRAETTANELRSISRGTESASKHLFANEIRAVLDYAKADMLRHRGNLYARRASLIAADAGRRLAELARLKGIQEGLAAQQPGGTLAELKKQLDSATARSGELRKVAGQLAAIVGDRESQLKEAADAAADSQAKMDQMLAAGLTSANATEYEKLSIANRSAERRASELRNGTLRGAELAASDDNDLAPPTYEGGTPELGLRDIELRRNQAVAMAGLAEQAVKALKARRDAVEGLGEAFAKQESAVGEKTAALASEIGAAIEEVDALFKTTRSSCEDSLKLFASAGQYARAAASDASARTKSASQEQSTAGTGAAAELYKRIAADGDMEASMQCLVAECAYQSASLRAGMIDSVEDSAPIRSRFAELGGSSPASAEIDADALQKAALADLGNALKAYASALTLLGRTNVTFADGPISGRNYLWQIQIGRAAVHLLQARILAGDAEQRDIQIAEAYKALSEAAKGREQSPLIAPAIDTLEYLQQTIK